MSVSQFPPMSIAYWVGEAVGSTDFADLEQVPDVVTTAVDMLVHNCVHVAIC